MRKLTSEEIAKLQGQFCHADDWNNITVPKKFSVNNIHLVSFSGKITLGLLDKEITMTGGIKLRSGLRGVRLHNCHLGDNVLIENVQSYIANYRIGDGVVIQNLDIMYLDGVSTFGNEIKVAVLNESGGREVTINDNLSSHFAYLLSLYRHRPKLIQNLQQMVTEYSESIASDMGEVGAGVRIINSGSIKNVKIGECAHIEGVSRLENGSINSNRHAPVKIGYGVIAEDFIISSGSEVVDGVMLRRCFLGQACHLGSNYSATDSLFFGNCHGENGEACAIFAGPYTVTHHKSTLLIAGMFSFMNAGSGSNQSNHMYKLGPIHQGIIERGGKTTSDSYISWPAKIGAFSLIMGRHLHNSDTSNMPFSYLVESLNQSELIPGANLRSVGTIRDAQKFPKRDKRTDPNRLDQINFNLLSPYTIQKMFRAVAILKRLQQNCGATSEFYTYQSCLIKNASLQRGLKLYDMAINKFLGNSLVSRLEKSSWSTIEEIRQVLTPNSDTGSGEWSDLSGLIAPKSEIEQLITQIEQGKLTTIEEFNHSMEELHNQYYTLEWSWAWKRIQGYYKVTQQEITIPDIVEIIQQWHTMVVDMDWMFYEDAKKEFSLSAQTGFGADGSTRDQKLDFEQVRGAFEQNDFVQIILKHIDTKTDLRDKVISRLRKAAK